MNAMKNPRMAEIKGAAFRKWVENRFDTMAEDSGWARDNAALVPQARRIAAACAKNQPLYIEDTARVGEEITDFEDVLRTPEYRKEWEGAKEFLIQTGQVKELVPGTVQVSSGRPEWFKHKGKRYV